MEVRQFQGGQSNPTYRIVTPAGNYVLRKKPAGKLLPSAHAIEREFAVMRALAGHVPVPRMHLFCDDESVLGQAFYIMELVDGRVMPDARMLDAPQGERRALCLELVTVLARLHRVDYRAVGLGEFGRPEGYVARQLARWSKQYAASRVEDNADMDQLIPWLEENLPATEETSIVHGDYRSYNVLFARQEPRIAAVLDWELATIGHPLADLAYCCLPYYLPPEDVRGFQGESPQALGIPPEEELMAAYCREAGRSELPDWRYFLVFSLFRSSAIRAGVFKRALDGTAANAQALEAGQRYRGSAACAWRLAQTSPRG
ncbi:MAG: phosphotransferase family protein [Rhodospirillaceae bacterium]|nr:MAG: phosphotransferase family protein [Rhodospirillaceae bacterium]